MKPERHVVLIVDAGSGESQTGRDGDLRVCYSGSRSDETEANPQTDNHEPMPHYTDSFLLWAFTRPRPSPIRRSAFVPRQTSPVPAGAPPTNAPSVSTVLRPSAALPSRAMHVEAGQRSKRHRANDGCNRDVQKARKISVGRKDAHEALAENRPQQYSRRVVDRLDVIPLALVRASGSTLPTSGAPIEGTEGAVTFHIVEMP